jgi:hypothetical protein
MNQITPMMTAGAFSAGSANPRSFYWLAEDGRVFSGPLEQIVTTDDPGYLQFFGSGNIPTRWPMDVDGNQTEAALQQAIGPVGMFANLAYYAADVRRRKVASSITVNGLLWSTDPLTFGSLNSAYIYTQSNAGATFAWKLLDGSFITLNKADVDALHEASNAFAQNCYKCEDTTLDGIEAGTITTREQVDAAFAAIQSSFTGLTADATKVRHQKRR